MTTITPTSTTRTRPDGVVETVYEPAHEWAARVVARAVTDLNSLAEAHGALPMCTDRSVFATPRAEAYDGQCDNLSPAGMIARGARMAESVARGECGFRGRTMLYAAHDIFRGIHGDAYSGPLKAFWESVAPGAMSSLVQY